MNPSRWERIESLFERATEVPRSERDAFMAREVDDDPELRAELAALLEASEGAAGYLTALGRDLLGSAVLEIVRDAPRLADAPDPWIGSTVAHYEILDRIGDGGMGVVYRARDLRLERPVALKFIAPQFSRDVDARRRFLREARAASTLDHPNICTIHEIAETGDGRLFIAMVAYEGETLRTRLERGPVAREQAFEISEQLARALAAAHAHGIVHRDVKPENVFLTRDGGVKLLDFGLAHAGDGASSEVGVFQGTVAYMSPEQASGQRADERSDVWALGVILFEMLAGTRPFAAADSRAAIQSILTSEPDLSARRPDLPVGVTTLVHRALSKDPAGRFATGGELLEALRACGSDPARPDGRHRARGLRGYRFRTAALVLPATAAVVATIVTAGGRKQGGSADSASAPHPSVVIMPFVGSDGGVESAALGADLGEQVRATLALVPGLDLMPAVTPSPARTMAATGGVRWSLSGRPAVDGSLRRQGGRVLVSVRLLDGQTREPLWTGSWDRADGDRAALRDELSLAIADSLRLRVAPYQPKTYTENRRAYDRFLQGVYAHRRFTPEDIWAALQFYREAWEEDPTFALAHAVAGNAYIDLTHLGLSPMIGLERAREHVLEALSLDSTLAEGHAALGFVQIWGDRQFELGERSLRRAIMLYPTLPQARGWYAWYALDVRDWRDAAVANMRGALDVDPLNTARSHMVELMLYRARRYDEVPIQHGVTWSLDPEVARSLRDSPLADAYREMGRHEESVAEFLAWQERTGRPPAAGLAITYARMGRVREARAILRDMETRGQEAPIAIARIHANLGDFDRAFQWLERAWRTRPHALLSIRSDPALDMLRADPRFGELLSRMGLSPS